MRASPRLNQPRFVRDGAAGASAGVGATFSILLKLAKTGAAVQAGSFVATNRLDLSGT
jgi:hypothetical protein